MNLNDIVLTPNMINNLNIVYEKPIIKYFNLSVPLKIVTDNGYKSDIYIQTPIIKIDNVYLTKSKNLYAKIPLIDNKFKKIIDKFDEEIPTAFNKNFCSWVNLFSKCEYKNIVDLYHSLGKDDLANVKFPIADDNRTIPVTCFDKNRNYLMLTERNIQNILCGKRIQMIINIKAINIHNSLSFTLEREISQIYIIDDLNLFDKNMFSFVQYEDDMIDLLNDNETKKDVEDIKEEKDDFEKIDAIDNDIEMTVYKVNNTKVVDNGDDYVFLYEKDKDV